MKKIQTIFLTILCMSLFSFVGCFLNAETSDEVSNNDEISKSSESSNIDNSSDTGDSSNVIYYTVIFNSDGGTTTENVKVECGSRICKPNNPTKTSTLTVEYEFLGWFYNDVEWDFDNELVFSDLELVAKWKEVNYTSDLPIRR